ncbi:zinc finger CCHC domain-containing protein 7 [Spea bombifrons]|uniref:zinc finger CCHC domain-containing protein 7 n=1 Tax=Spea bombifrons TaxID=233779 RepID=UPI00234BD2C2|nr:zinc finger CCHC domain-containing protein 7 [Spea bombifrons]XP_053321797.1 zinc finger CCHC domain-containing protein 7 [Spea bombifrons]
MFNGDEELKAYEDELYREESSSDESIDSEVEFYLYSQVHYSQNLSESNVAEVDGEPEEKQQFNNDTNVRADCNVITISDSDEVKFSDSSAVIILSDTLEEDSVYSTKIKSKEGRSSLQGKPTIHSTPINYKTSKSCSKLASSRLSGQLSSSKSYKGGLVQEVLVIRGSSEDENESESEEDETSESDQSDVENWMLLGRAKEDGDTSIQLNLEGYRSPPSPGEGGIDWSISERDLEAQIGNYNPLRRSNRYYTDKNVVCRNCDKRGHLSKNCPTPRKQPACCLCGERGHFQNSCPARYCSNCFLPGHFSQECIERAYWKKSCHRCSMTGHYADACPEIWRQYHLTVKPGPIKKSKLKSGQKDLVFCCNCARKGHCSYECSEKRMYNGTFPTCQLVFSYDRDHDILKRNERAKNKIKELRDVGLLPFEITKPYMDKEHNMPPSKKMKKKHLKESRRLHREQQQKHTSKKKAFLDIVKERKLNKKKNVLHSQEADQDFPRGNSVKSVKGKRKHFDNFSDKLFSESKKSKSADGLFKSHKRIRQRKKKGNQSTIDDSLLIIKQRKKKSKRNVD